MQIKCGTDITEVSRIEKSINELGDKFLDRIYTEKEKEYCEGKKVQKYQHYAARFAAKEAVFKAISENLENKFDIDWKDIEIINNEQGRPQVNLNERFTDNIENIDISISHCKEYAIVNVGILYK